MPDEIDRITDMTERQMENALEHRARQQARRAPGLTNCEQEGCGEAIAPMRTEMGARLCMTCATADEARSAHLAAWRRR
ncbi:hypothetical protein PQS31_06150 [Luteimonas sp BLCC-B24]|uniref:hypothetical protein n=1 Tax=Luteimonas sp. BLCC-B24 TaxID=3025317 RepID=UPI00234E1D8B|nr:hypothetical protein [Luteimonas sp. BLCC-B24]MDC7806405.1 hypothetical protein [Luteimonas sp. BLCC-B24]